MGSDPHPAKAETPEKQYFDNLKKEKQTLYPPGWGQPWHRDGLQRCFQGMCARLMKGSGMNVSDKDGVVHRAPR